MKNKGFSFVELLVVISIIAILGAMLLPIVVRAKAERTKVASSFIVDGKDVKKGDILYTVLGGDKVQVVRLNKVWGGDEISIGCRTLVAEGDAKKYETVFFKLFELTYNKDGIEQEVDIGVKKTVEAQEEWDKEKR